jgi:N-acetylglucosaminyldiphosphoundecaprenol N-acetyl-beta-D-mannosaminyltransferase
MISTAAPEPTSRRPESVAAAPHALGGDDFDRDVWSLFGVPIDMVTAPQAVEAILAAARDRRPLSFITPNVNFLVRALRDREARRRLLEADLSLVDGAPLVFLARLLGAPARARCAGSDVFEALRRRAGFPGRRLRVFFFGGRPGAAEAAAAAVDREARGVESAGFLNPGDGDVDSLSADWMIDAINAARPDFVLVALGAAKGQAWIDRNRARLSAPVIAHLGAVMDFTAGTKARAPRLLRRLGLEWAWRIKEEPALWRRYWSDAGALAALLAARLWPALRPPRRAGAPAGATVEFAADGAVVRLQGDLCAENLEPVRRAFRAAAERGAATLDLSAADGVDAAFLGLVLMLEKRLGRRGGALRVAGARPPHLRLLSAHSIDYARVEAARPRPETERAIAGAV